MYRNPARSAQVFFGIVLTPMYKDDDDRDDPDLVPRPVMTVGQTFVVGADGIEVGTHHHRKAQLIYTARGVLTCEVSQGLSIVPPRSVWNPGGTRHSVKGVGTLEVYGLFVDPASAPTMPDACCTVSVSPLLRELLLRCARFPALYPLKGRNRVSRRFCSMNSPPHPWRSCTCRCRRTTVCGGLRTG